MHRFLVRFSESEASNHTPTLVDFTTTTPELKFSVHTSTHARIRGQDRLRLSLQSEPTGVGSSAAGSTHAWAEVFVSGAGWITFELTNSSVGGFNLIPVAVARDIRQTTPVSGSFVGGTSAFAEMSVEVLVTS